MDNKCTEQIDELTIIKLITTQGSKELSYITTYQGLYDCKLCIAGLLTFQKHLQFEGFLEQILEFSFRYNLLSSILEQAGSEQIYPEVMEFTSCFHSQSISVNIFQTKSLLAQTKDNASLSKSLLILQPTKKLLKLF